MKLLGVDNVTYRAFCPPESDTPLAMKFNQRRDSIRTKDSSPCPNLRGVSILKNQEIRF
jgi:hypothetical protein